MLSDWVSIIFVIGAHWGLTPLKKYKMDTLQPHSFKGMNETVAEMIAVDIAKLIVVSEINNVELEELIHSILEQGIEDHYF